MVLNKLSVTESGLEIFRCNHSSGNSSAVLIYGSVCFSVSYKSRFPEFNFGFSRQGSSDVYLADFFHKQKPIQISKSIYSFIRQNEISFGFVELK